jgi:hypothetical protein
LLLAPRLEEAAREAFLGAIGEGVRQRASVPVIALRTGLEEAPLGEGVLSVPWPCETRALAEWIEAALADGPQRRPMMGRMPQARFRPVASKARGVLGPADPGPGSGVVPSGRGKPPEDTRPRKGRPYDGPITL